MKVLISILSSFLYLSLSLNITFNVHYCKDEFKSVSFLANSHKCCCATTEASFCSDNNNCCENIRYAFLFDADEKNTNPITISSKHFLPVKAKKNTSDNIISKQDKKIKYSFYDIPPPKKNAIYKQICSLVFYG